MNQTNEMMRTRFLPAVVALLAAALSFSACQVKFAEEKAAVSDKITATMGEVKNLTFNTFEFVGQTTVGEEIEMRTNQFKTKLEQDQKFYDMYAAGRAAAKAAEKKHAIERDQLHLMQLDSIRNALGARLDEIAYRDFKFSAVGKLEGGKLEATDWYAAIAPDGTVLSLVQDKKNLHKGLGVTIPGYKDLFDE